VPFLQEQNKLNKTALMQLEYIRINKIKQSNKLNEITA